jgi:hypothetical protein
MLSTVADYQIRIKIRTPPPRHYKCCHKSLSYLSPRTWYVSPCTMVSAPRLHQHSPLSLMTQNRASALRQSFLVTAKRSPNGVVCTVSPNRVQLRSPQIATDTVTIHYVGTLDNGTVFDSSRDRQASHLLSMIIADDHLSIVKTLS